MSIASELTRIQGAKSDLRTSIINKGVQVPQSALIDSYSGYVDQIQQGSSGNLFDGADLKYLLYKGRFLDNLDDIYNSSRGNLTSWSLNYFGNGISGVSESNAQKILNIISKFGNCGSGNDADLSYALDSVSLGDNVSNLTFAPTISKNGTLNISGLFGYFEAPSGKELNLTIDFNNVEANTIIMSNAFNIRYARNKFKVLNLPISNISASIVVGNTYYSYVGSLIEITVRGALKTNKNIDVRSATNMSIANYINFFNSFDTTASTNSKVIIPSLIYNQLTEDQKAIITDKGYILAT